MDASNLDISLIFQFHWNEIKTNQFSHRIPFYFN